MMTGTSPVSLVDRIRRHLVGLKMPRALEVLDQTLRRLECGDRGREGFRLPSLRTVRAVLPHTALQSLVSTSGVSRCFPGSVQGEESWFREEGARLP